MIDNVVFDIISLICVLTIYLHLEMQQLIKLKLKILKFFNISRKKEIRNTLYTFCPCLGLRLNPNPVRFCNSRLGLGLSHVI